VKPPNLPEGILCVLIYWDDDENRLKITHNADSQAEVVDALISALPQARLDEKAGSRKIIIPGFGMKPS